MCQSYHTLINNYCTVLKRCLQYYHNKSSNKGDTHVHTRRGMLFINDFPIEAVELTGAKLWKYKDVILSGNVAEIENACVTERSDGITPETQKDIAEAVINNIIVVWRTLKSDEKINFTSQIQELLKIYTSILLLEKSSRH